MDQPRHPHQQCRARREEKSPLTIGTLRLCAALALVAVAACSDTPDAARTPGSRWVDAWQVAPVGQLPDGCGRGTPVPAFINNRGTAQTVRMTARPSVEGDSLRVRVSNRFGDRELKLSHVTVARPAQGVALVPGSVRDARFGGSRAVTIPVGKEATSDAVNIAVNPDRDVTISIGIVASGKLTWHVAGPLTSYATSSGTGDRTTETSGASFRRGVGSYVLLTGIQVHASTPTPAIVALGDSLTDGGSATPDTNWLGILGGRLREDGRPHAVIDAGIACNDLTITSRLGGVRASDRFKADVLDRVGVTHVIIFEGTNDVFGGVAPQKVIDALAALAARAHAAGLRVIGATLIPKRDSPSPQREGARQTVNTWIRTTRAFDGVIDFDAAVRSIDHPDRIQPMYAGDAIHPNGDGQAAMGNAISLGLFTRSAPLPS